MLCLVVLVFQFIGYVPRLTAMDVQSDMKSEAIGLVKKMITQENDRDIEEQLYLYAEHAEIGGRKLNIGEIRKELAAYYERWPQAEWVLLEEPVFNNIDSTRSEVVYKAKYRLESAPRKKWSSGVIVSTVGLVATNGEPRISYIKDATSDVRNGDFSEEGANDLTASDERSDPSASDSRPANDSVPSNSRPMEALLIANSDYSNFPKLGSPKTDALVLADSLRKLGFATRLVENANREQMLDEIKGFEDRLKNTRGVAFFHFGGHGIQVDGSNYLIPADADIPDERRVSTRAVELNEVMGALDVSGSEVNIVVLDACRDNPLPASTRSATRGLAVVGSKPKNSIVIYAAEAGSKANDGLFTPILARELIGSGRSLSEIMTRVRKEVHMQSGGTQIPGEYSQLFEQVYLGVSRVPDVYYKPDEPDVKMVKPHAELTKPDIEQPNMEMQKFGFIDKLKLPHEWLVANGNLAAEYFRYLSSLKLKNISAAQVIEAHAIENGGVWNCIPPKMSWRRMGYTLRVVERIAQYMGVDQVNIIVAYRSPEYNKQCVRSDCGFDGQHSWHQENIAVDFNFPGISPDKVTMMAKQLRDEGLFRGAVGQHGNYTHLDARGKNIDLP
jgi:hypothetical protein